MERQTTPSIAGQTSHSILFEGGVTVSNNFTNRRQNGCKIGTRDKFATLLRWENFISIEIVIYAFFTIVDFPIQFSIYTSCRIHHVFRAWGAYASISIYATVEPPESARYNMVIL